MAAKIEEARVRAFLDALAGCGNATLAAEKAGVSRSWAGKKRRAEPGFDAACRGALAKAARRLAGRESNLAPKAWRGAGAGENLVRRGSRSGAQVVRSAAVQWTRSTEEAFLAVLRDTANLSLSCERVGMSEPSLLAHRKRWAGFERRVQRALAEAPARLEAAWRARPRPDFGAEWCDSVWPEGLKRPFTVGEAIDIMRRRQGMETARRRKEERAEREVRG